MRVFLFLLILVVVADAALAAGWSCDGPKPGHPTAAERATFVTEIRTLAVAAEKKHGVPAAALAALAIVESAYGWTRPAVDANNLFGWRAGPDEARAGLAYVPSCARSRARFRRFKNRADAFDLVASRLAVLENYRGYTERYRVARQRGGPVEPAVVEWVAGIAPRYSRNARSFTEKMTRVMNDPEQRGEPVSPEATLYALSRHAHGAR